MLDGQDWRDAGLRYTRSSICCLLVSYPLKNKKIHTLANPAERYLHRLTATKSQRRYQWILIDLPRDASQITHQL